MFGDACCTFIPKNTAANDSCTEALTKLETLADENRMQEQTVPCLYGLTGFWGNGRPSYCRSLQESL